MSDPFDVFRRECLTKTQDPLDVKAELFEEQFHAQFRLSDSIWAYYLPARGGDVDLGDQALFQGLYASWMALKYAVTSNQSDADNVRQAVDGMGQQQPSGRLIRGIDPRTRRMQDDASNDSASGHLAGLHFVLRYGDKFSQGHAAALIHDWASHILTHGDALAGPKGDPTTFGQLIEGWKTDPLRLTLYLAIMKLAGTVYSRENGEPFNSAYRETLAKFRPLVRYPKVRALWVEKDYDTHRAAIHLSVLADLEEDPRIKADYVAGLTRIWEMTRKSVNVWVAFLVARHNPDVVAPDIRAINAILREFEIGEKSGNFERRNSLDAELWKSAGVRFIQYGGKLRASQPLPVWKRPAQEFIWQRNQFDVDGWIGNTTPDLHYNGGDFLCAWWGWRELYVERPVYSSFLS